VPSTWFPEQVPIEEVRVQGSVASGAGDLLERDLRVRDRLVVDVDHAALTGRFPIRHLVHVAQGGQPGADVDELPDPVTHHVTPGPAEERPVRAGEVPDLGQPRATLPASRTSDAT
jgi:hypothetical protein